MFVNWAHYLVPKISFFLSFVLNQVFVCLIHSNKNVLFGNYRYLLYFFAVFNLCASAADLLIPVTVFCYRYAFVTLVVDGPFALSSEPAEAFIAFRASFLSGTYGILNVHFIFRYLALKSNNIIKFYFMPYGLLLSVIYVLFHMSVWAMIDYFCLHSASEMRDYIRIPFRNLHNESIDNINLVAGLFSEASPEIVQRSWAGIVLLTVIASYSMVLYFVLGYKIITGLNIESVTMSHQTTQMQKQLFKALTIQTIIPICVSFMPCSFSFYGAALNIGFMNWVYWLSAVAVSMFPFLDPLAIILLLPALRRRLPNPIRKYRGNSVSVVPNQISEASFGRVQ
ncbi:Serpentine Receptor, class J [Caenorhabditis elegans]|uniref:Serpentine Receptor, class J n=1 Tax=Caenorhabditis elegans TaxID=6239 RepID=Q9N4X5_CAEEL|nr:Serpentine Receptor, class J [Caenorhabditis elegans]CCD62309.1 Serpentine Receptor, class J [Caenorhabditis elegans]|eukprot:NP_503704.1 Serpentine Receptor, class J [Caenorhabditis elegans]